VYLFALARFNHFARRLERRLCGHGVDHVGLAGEFLLHAVLDGLEHLRQFSLLLLQARRRRARGPRLERDQCLLLGVEHRPDGTGDMSHDAREQILLLREDVLDRVGRGVRIRQWVREWHQGCPGKWTCLSPAASAC